MRTNHTSATKNRATAFPNWIAGNCIQVFLIAMRSEKWFVAERMPMKRWIGSSGTGRAFHLSDISKTCWREKLGWAFGSAVAYTEWTSMPPVMAKPDASSRVNPWQILAIKKISTQWFLCQNFEISLQWNAFFGKGTKIYHPMRKWGNMAASHINIISFNASLDSENKHLPLWKWKWPCHFRFLCSPDKSVEPWACLCFLRLNYVLPLPFLTFSESIDCKVNNLQE